MDNRKDLLPAAMSFMLPGLGHVFSGNALRGMFFFGLFTLLNGTAATRVIVPMVVVVASWDAYRTTPAEKDAVSQQKRAAFLAVGFISFLAWMSMVAMVLLPYGKQDTINRTVEYLSDGVKACARELKRLPATLDECGDGFAKVRRLKDPWGLAYAYRPQGEGRFEIRSAGRDGNFDTEDDFIYRYTYR